MPCDSVRLTGVKLEACSPEHMLAALTDLRLSPQLTSAGLIYFGNGESIDCKTGEAQLGRFRDVNEIKRAYSGAVVRATAKKFGWSPQATKQVEGLTQTTYSRR